MSPTPNRRSLSPFPRFVSFFAPPLALLAGLGTVLFAGPPRGAQSNPSATWSVEIVLPPKIVANQPATLAVFGVDGRLASGVTVEIGKDIRATTDSTGRANFVAPATDQGMVLARASGVSAAALVDPADSWNGAQAAMALPPASLKDRLAICAGGFRGDADANRVKINGDAALVLAASPECVVILPGPRLIPGSAKISIETAGREIVATTTLVSLHYDPPQPPLAPGKKSRLVVGVQGSEQPLDIVLENRSPGVIRFLRGDAQEIRTSGGAQNSASVEVQALRSGDFSFHGRLQPQPDPRMAARYLGAAWPLAPKNMQSRVKNLARRLERHPRDSAKIGRELDKIVSETIAGDFRTLLESAAAAL